MTQCNFVWKKTQDSSSDHCSMSQQNFSWSDHKCSHKYLFVGFLIWIVFCPGPFKKKRTKLDWKQYEKLEQSITKKGLRKCWGWKTCVCKLKMGSVEQIERGSQKTLTTRVGLKSIKTLWESRNKMIELQTRACMFFEWNNLWLKVFLFQCVLQ